MPTAATRRTAFYLLLLLVTTVLAAACGLLGSDNNPSPSGVPQDVPDTAATVAAAVLQTATVVEDNPSENAPDYRATIRAALPEDPPDPTPTDAPAPDTAPREQHAPGATPTPEHLETVTDPHSTPDNPTPTVIPTHLAELHRGPWLQEHHPQTAKAIHSLPWMIDGIRPDETEMAQELVDLAIDRPPLVATIAAQPWIRDGITSEEHDFIVRVTTAYDDSHTPTKIMTMPWLNDGITTEEHETLSFILRTGETNPELARALLDLGWLHHGVYPREQPALESLKAISRADPETATRIARMPFLKILEPADLNALRSLADLALHSPADLRKILSRPEWPERPNDKYSDIITLLYNTNTRHPHLLDAILDRKQVKVQRRVIKTTTTGPIWLAVIRTQTGANRSLALLEHAVRTIDYFTSHRFPNQHIALLFAETDAPAYYDTHIVIPTRYDVNDGSALAAATPRIISRLIARHHWHGDEYWVEYGLSRLLASISEQARHGAPLNATTPPCPVAHTITELNRAEVSWTLTHDCHHAIGERFFLSLYRNAGRPAFRRGLQHLLQAPDRTGIGIEQIADAFRGSRTALEISADRWYNGSLHQTFAPQDAGDGILTSIDGVVDDVYLVVGEQDEPVTQIHADGTSKQLHLVVEYSYHIVDGPYALDLNTAIRYEDGFSYQHRPFPITAEEGSHSRVAKIPVGNLPGQQWATGSYWVEVFDGKRKVAQAELTVTAGAGPYAP